MNESVTFYSTATGAAALAGLDQHLVALDAVYPLLSDASAHDEDEELALVDHLILAGLVSP